MSTFIIYDLFILFFCFSVSLRRYHRRDMFPSKYRNAEKISAGTSARSSVHQSVPSARHGRRSGRWHGRTDTRVCHTPRPAVLSGTGRVRPGPILQRWQRKTRRRLPTVRRWSAHMHRYVPYRCHKPNQKKIMIIKIPYTSTTVLPKSRIYLFPILFYFILFFQKKIVHFSTKIFLFNLLDCIYLIRRT